MQEAPFYEDLLGDAGRDLASYFDPREFRARAQLEDEQYWHLHRRGVILDALRRAAPGIGRLVEIGCGAGTVATYLNENGFEVDYADVHREALEVARARARARLGERADARRFVRIDVCRQDLPGRYDGVLMLDVLEHLPDDHEVARRIRAWLAPGGLFLFTVPAFPVLWSPWDDVEKHKRRYTMEGARALAEGAGFSVERATYFFFPLFFAAGGVKCLRVAKGLVVPPRPAAEFTDLVEARSTPALNAAMLRLLDVERRFLERRDLPLGTSLLCVARAR